MVIEHISNTLILCDECHKETLSIVRIDSYHRLRIEVSKVCEVFLLQA